MTSEVIAYIVQLCWEKVKLNPCRGCSAIKAFPTPLDLSFSPFIIGSCKVEIQRVSRMDYIAEH